MRKSLKILFQAIGWSIAAVVIAVIGAVGYGAWLYAQADMKRPDIRIDMAAYPLTTDTDSLRICRDNSLFHNRYGLWEAKITGTAVERGASLGVMSRDLLYYQEQVFVEQIRHFIPSEWYLRFLHTLIVIFNRDIASYIPDEYRTEIYATAQSCSHDYDLFGDPYERQLNYHAAHDIGHTMQEYMLVGCSSFAVWGDHTADSKLLIGRNFDFYVGDDFAKNKEIVFAAPDKGYQYASVSWPGMIGVLSGMNEKGLTVTINASKGSIPTSSAMPISLLAREILQYAASIDEAYAIAQSRRTFVSESLLIGSAAEHRAAIIEKTPDRIALYRGGDEQVICTNHYQSAEFANEACNADNIARSDSKYRSNRLSELLGEQAPLTPEKAAAVLRDRYGLHGKDIGLTNEKSINQSIAHHAVIFAPEELKMWVSTSPWQSGAFVCYDLGSIFRTAGAVSTSLATPQGTIAADSAFLRSDYRRITDYRRLSTTMRQALRTRHSLPDAVIDSLVEVNPNFYDTYDLCGDFRLMNGDREAAVAYWRTALTKEIPRANDREEIERKIKKYGKR